MYLVTRVNRDLDLYHMTLIIDLELSILKKYMRLITLMRTK